MRIGLLCHRGIGGSVRVSIELGAELAARGCAVHLFARSAPMGLRPPADVTLHTTLRSAADQIVSTELDLRWAPDEIDALVALIVETVEAERLDVLHFHYAVPFAEVLHRVRYRLSQRTPALVGTLHGTDVSGFGEPTASRDALKAALGSLDAITTVSRNYAERATRAFGRENQPMVIPNFVDTRRFRPAVDDARAGRPPMIMHVSNFRPVKQPESMACIFQDVRSRLPATLGLVGDGHGLSSVRAFLETAGLADDIRYFGVRTSIETLLPEARVLVVTSRDESFCLAALEAAACGVPVVAPRVGGLPEVVSDGETGLLFEPGNERQATDAVVRLLTHPTLHTAMAQAAAERARHFDARVVVGRYLDLYRQTMAARRQHTAAGLLIGSRS